MAALAKEDITALWRRPRLRARVNLAAPDCHKTEVTVTDLRTGATIDRWPCFYFRIWVENTGEVRAEQVQVFIRALLRRHADGAYRVVANFLPMNLKWSHTGVVFAQGLSPQMGQFCDVGHIVHPSNAATAGHALDTAEGQAVMCLDVEAASNTRSHLLAPGAYRIDLLIGAANSKPVAKSIDLTLTGEWFDEADAMFTDGIGFRETT